MRILVDTNVLVRLAEPKHVMHATAREAVTVLCADENVLVLVPQVMYELWAVVTRPKEANGLGDTPEDALKKLREFEQAFVLLRDERAIYERWLELVRTGQVRGRKAHDTHLVAAMVRHGVDHILTFNDGDFRRYDEVTILMPAEIARN